MDRNYDGKRAGPEAPLAIGGEKGHRRIYLPGVGVARTFFGTYADAIGGTLLTQALQGLGATKNSSATQRRRSAGLATDPYRFAHRVMER